MVTLPAWLQNEKKKKLLECSLDKAITCKLTMIMDSIAQLRMLYMIQDWAGSASVKFSNTSSVQKIIKFVVM